RNKLVFATGTAVAIALILGVIGTTVGLLRAKRAQALVLHSRSEAEKLSNFMLDDLYAKLEPSGEFETVIRLAKQAAAYYDGLPPSLRTRETEQNRAIARGRLALVTAKQGDFKTAVPLATESVAVVQKMRQQGDQSEGTIFALVLALEAFFRGYNSGFGAGSDIVSFGRAVQHRPPV